MEERTLLQTDAPGGYPPGGVGNPEATRVIEAPGAPYGAPAAGGYEQTQQAIAVTCPVCGTPNGPSERYCQDCGLLFGSIQGEVEPLPDLSQLPRLTDGAGKEYSLNPGANSVGRDAADILIADPTVSRRHAQLTLENGQAIVEDLGSTNGTQVSGRRLAPGERAPAFNGDAVRFGSITLTLNLPGAGARPAEAASAPAPAEDRGEALGFLVIGEGQEVPLYEGVNTIGRRSGNQVIIPDAFMSGKHAEITVKPDGTAEFVDIGSTNGSFLGDERLAPQAVVALTEGVTVRLGKTPVYYRAAAPAPILALPANTLVEGPPPAAPAPPQPEPAENADAAFTTAVGPAAEQTVLPE